MKARGRLVSLLMALVCLLPIGMSLFSFGQSASAAAPEMIKVTLHKKKMDDFPTGKTNTGEIDPDFDKYEGLEGVEFRPWDVTDAFYDLLKAEGITGSETKEVYEAAVKKVMKEATKQTFEGNLPTGGAKKVPVSGVGAKSTGTDGTVVFENLPDRDANGVYRVYWFEETEKEGVGQFDQLVLLALPVEKITGSPGANHDIHLYPKNKLANKPVKELLKDDGSAEDVNQDRISYDIGKEIKYKVTYQIPMHIGDVITNADGTRQTRYRKLVFKDEVTHDGVRFDKFDSIKVIGGTPEDIKGEIDSPISPVAVTEKFNFDTGYAATGKKAGFQIAMRLDDVRDSIQSINTATWLKKYAGKKIEIVYTVKLTEDTPVDQDIKNNFYVDLQQTGETDVEPIVPEETPPALTTGGKKFVKHEEGKDTQTLKGAEFVITNEAGTKYLQGNANNYTWKDIVDDKYEEAIKITSADGGLFEIKGLKYGTYKLVETKAPDGFKLGGPVTFIVDKDTYSEATSLQKVANVSRGGFLPSTGGAGIIAFLVIGLSLMGIAVVRYRKTQHTA